MDPKRTYETDESLTPSEQPLEGKTKSMAVP
jgi:hypothetical protein